MIRRIALYQPNEHQPLATRFGQDIQVAILSYRSLALWLLGFPEAALKDAENAVKVCPRAGSGCFPYVCFVRDRYFPHAL